MPFTRGERPRWASYAGVDFLPRQVKTATATIKKTLVFLFFEPIYSYLVLMF